MDGKRRGTQDQPIRTHRGWRRVPIIYSSTRLFGWRNQSEPSAAGAVDMLQARQRMEQPLRLAPRALIPMVPYEKSAAV